MAEMNADIVNAGGPIWSGICAGPGGRAGRDADVIISKGCTLRASLDYAKLCLRELSQKRNKKKYNVVMGGMLEHPMPSRFTRGAG